MDAGGGRILGEWAIEGYSFIRVNEDGSPVRWNPCRAIHYVVNAGAGPPEARALVREAVARIPA